MRTSDSTPARRTTPCDVCEYGPGHPLCHGCPNETPPPGCMPGCGCLLLALFIAASLVKMLA